jgi:hypothetical protein
MKKIFLIACILIFTKGNSQDTTKTNSLTISGYLEIYYSYDFSNPPKHKRPSFFYSFNRHNEVNLNLGFIKANYTTDNVRANLSLMTGTYSQYNLAAEHPIFQHLLEGNVGIKISKTKNLWMDAGVMTSHIGFESAIGKDCWNLTRSILADNSPYYESGVKMGYTSQNEKLYLAAMYLNGWQHIQRLPGNNTPAFGTQLTYKPNSKSTLNWSTFIGNEQPDSLKQWRFFNNFYGLFQINENFGLTAGFDVGLQQKSKGSNSYNIWYSPVLIVRYSPTDKIRIAARGEYYSDEEGVIITTGTPNGFQTFGYSINFDYLVTPNVLFRIEGRGLNSKDPIFILNKKPSSENYFITASIPISF